MTVIRSAYQLRDSEFCEIGGLSLAFKQMGTSENSACSKLIMDRKQSKLLENGMVVKQMAALLTRYSLNNMVATLLIKSPIRQHSRFQVLLQMTAKQRIT